MNKYELRRFRGLLIHSLVTPMNMKKSSLNFGDQPLKFYLGRSFIWAVRIDTWLIRLRKHRLFRIVAS